MATIEERARDYAVNVTVDELNKEGLDPDSFAGIMHGYIKGATDQRKIDIEKACDWLYECVGTGEQFKKTLVEKFRKAMEE